MISTGKCPKCGNVVSSARIEAVDIKQGFESVWHGVSFVCPNFSCQTVLGIGIDPIAIKTDIVKEVLRGLGKG